MTDRSNNESEKNSDTDSAKVESESVEANQKMIAESPSVSGSSNSITNQAESVFDQSRRSSAAMAERGDLPSLQIDTGKEKGNGDKGNGDKEKVEEDDGPPIPEEDLKEMREGMIDAKAKTKGWDSNTPPSVEELKEIIGDSQVLFWGDDHLDENSPERFKQSLENLKKAGVDTVAMEGFREDQQDLVNDWLKAEKGSPKANELESQMRDYLNKAINDPMYVDKIMQFMQAAKDAGMKVLCIEPNGGMITNNGDGTPMNRDSNWKKTVENYLKDNPDSKVMILAGSGHFIHMRGETVSDMMKKDGTKTTDLTPPSQFIDGEIILPNRK